MTTTRRARLLRWRDWHVRTKLAAVTLVPLVFAVALGIAQIHDQVARADSFRRVDHLVSLSDQLRRAIGGLQQERAESARLLAGGAEDLSAELSQEHRVTDTAWTAMSRAAEAVTFAAPATLSRAAETAALPADLNRLRVQVVGAELDDRTALTRYTELVGVLLAFDRALAGEIADPALSGTAAALHDLQLSNEEIYLQQAVVSTGLTRGVLAVSDVGALRASVARFDSRTADFRAAASDLQQAEYSRTVSGPAVIVRNQLLGKVLEQPDVRPTVPGISGSDWQTSSQLTSGAVAAVAGTLGRELSVDATRLQNAASDAAGLVSVIVFAAMLLAAMVMLVVGRQLVSSLLILRRSALAVADHKLPEAVAGLRSGALLPPDVAPVPLNTDDELGQVARAFDAVQDQALRLAAEQAHLRASYGDVFVNLSRRSQGLVQRQLHLLDQLERDEEDPDQLATLFQLDHLATRMRRNNENLMVLSTGNELARRAGSPVRLADLLRAAVSEIEQYQRVVVQPPPSLTVVGYAARDLVRLTAELLDNATAFSSPETKVTIASRLADDGTVAVDVLDSGIGMRAEEIADVNARLAEGGHLDASASRRMGLFVVGRLAGRHGVRVQLHGGKDIAGVRATLTIPGELLTDGDPAPLPRRVNGTNVSTTDMLARLTGSAAPVTTAAPEPEPEPSAEGDLFTTAAGSMLEPVVRSADTDEEITGWWEPAAPPDTSPDTAPGPPVDRGIHETTPIFDEMISAWFTDAGRAEAPTETWQFEADKGFEAAQVVTESPVGVTAAGLPQRVPKEKLLPGSISGLGGSAGAADPVVRGPHEAEALRERLNGLQRGLSRGRDQQPAEAFEEVREPVASPAGKGFLAAEEVMKSPEGVTSAGLPQRVPRERLVPGSIASPPGFGEGLVRGERGAQEVRGRLDEFQRGLNNGRRSLAGMENGQEPS
ncbi:MAG: nitrate- and nitrite sensing domain-containing protein [Kibdelosporangium sp.]